MFQGCEILMLDLVNKTWKGYNLSLPVSIPIKINFSVKSSPVLDCSPTIN